MYISAKYYLNWFSFHIVIMKVLGVNFFETQCIFVTFGSLCLAKLSHSTVIYECTLDKSESVCCIKMV